MTTRKGPMLEILGALVPPPLNRSVTNLVCANVLNYISISSLCRHWGAKNHKFDRFSTLSFCLGSAQRCRDKVEHGCTSMNIPLSNDTKFVSVLQCVNFFAPWRHAISEPYQTWHEVRTFLAPPKHVCLRPIVSLLGAAWFIAPKSVQRVTPPGRKTSKSPLSNRYTGAMRCAQCCR